jgi:hypothetical protein
MEITDSIVAVFPDHLTAEKAIRDLSAAGFAMNQLSVVGKGYHTDEQVVGFYNAGDRVRFWGTRGAFWGGLWGLFFGGLFLTIPVVGPVVVLGYIAAVAFSAIEGALAVGVLGVVGAALYSIGIPKDSVIDYQTAIMADGYIVMIHASGAEAGRAKAILQTAEASSVTHHPALPVAA